MVKVNQIVRFSPQRVARRLSAVLITAAAAVVIFGGQPQKGSRPPTANAPVLQMPVFYELPLLDVVTADRTANRRRLRTYPPPRNRGQTKGDSIRTPLQRPRIDPASAAACPKKDPVGTNPRGSRSGQN